MSSAPADRDTRQGAATMVVIARIFLTLSFLALLGAWLTQVTGGEVAGMSQQHLFNDAIVLALLGIASMLDAFWHARRL